MNRTRYILSVLIAFIVSNVLTTLWYSLMDEPNMVSFRREEMNYFGLVMNHLLYASIFVYLFPFYYDRKPGALRSATYGALLSAVMFIPSGMVVRSIWTVDFNSIFILNALAHIVIGALMALATAKIYHFKQEKQ